MFTRMAADMNGYGQNRLYLNTFDCFNLSMMQSQNGYRVLYTGSIVALANILPTSLISIPVYESIKPRLINMIESNKSEVKDFDRILAQIGASTLSAMIVLSIVYPLDTIKRCKQVIGTRGYSSINDSLSTTLNSIYNAFGVRGFYRGIHLALIKTFPAVYVQFLIYDYIKKMTGYDQIRVTRVSGSPISPEKVKSIITDDVTTA